MQFQTIVSQGVNLVQLMEGKQILFGVAPDHGARMTRLSFEGKDGFEQVLWEVSPEECKTGSWSKNEILFPFPNRIDGGRYEYNGKHYQLPINEPEKNNALHGMVTQASFKVIKEEIHNNQATLTLSYHYDGGMAYYPFPFTFEVAYRYTDFASLEVTFNAKNEGSETLPFGLGWHPYFKLGANGLSGQVFEMPQTYHLLLADRMIPSGEERAFDHTALNLVDWNLDDCFRIKGDERAYSLKSANLNLEMQADDAYQYLQLFTPEGLGTIAIEPMTSGVNVFNNKEGIRYLSKDETFQVCFKINAYH